MQKFRYNVRSAKVQYSLWITREEAREYSMVLDEGETIHFVREDNIETPDLSGEEHPIVGHRSLI